MWILPSRGRPNNIERLIEAWRLTEASTSVLLCLDEEDSFFGDYQNLKLPTDWLLYLRQGKLLSDVYNECFGLYPNLSWYGFIADDVVPLTPGWDQILISVASGDGMAVPAGSHDPTGAPHFVLGGDLVRSVRWLSLPGLARLYIDTVWQDIAVDRGVLRRVPDVLLQHRHFSNGLALFDQTYRKPSRISDRVIYETWRTNHDYSPRDTHSP